VLPAPMGFWPSSNARAIRFSRSSEQKSHCFEVEPSMNRKSNCSDKYWTINRRALNLAEPEQETTCGDEAEVLEWGTSESNLLK
jgi:hypothetical protein